jgi:hypothetical protein
MFLYNLCCTCLNGFNLTFASYFVRQTRSHILCFGKPESKSLSTPDAQTFLSPYTDRGTADQFRFLHGIFGNTLKYKIANMHDYKIINFPNIYMLGMLLCVI